MLHVLRQAHLAGTASSFTNDISGSCLSCCAAAAVAGAEAVSGVDRLEPRLGAAGAQACQVGEGLLPS
jgi:hypothetical protein